MKKRLFTITLSCLLAAGCFAAQKTDEFTTKNGKKVKITCIKHASMEINYNGVEIQVDPVGMHFDREAIHALRTPATAIYVNQAVFGHFKNGLVMKNGDKVKYADDITIEAVPAYNTTPGREQFHPKGRDNGYILTLDGLRIYIAGDTEDIPEMADLKDIDIAFLPCNQPYTMTVDQVVNAAKIIKPKILFPYHYNETPVHKISMQLFKEGIKVMIRDYQ